MHPIAARCNAVELLGNTSCSWKPMHVFASTARQMTQRAHRGIDHVVVRMDDARALHSRGLLGADEADGVVLSRRATGGLTFRLVESATA